MGRVENWRQAWRSHPLELVSPLSVQGARERLIVASTSHLQVSFMLGAGGGYVVFGRVGARRVSLEAGRPGARNAWRPVVRGRLEPAGTGCRLLGTIGVSPLVKLVSVLWLGGVVWFLFGSVAVVGARAVHGEASAEDVLSCLAQLITLAGFGALMAWGTLIDRGYATYLRSWLADRLLTEGPGGRLSPQNPSA